MFTRNCLIFTRNSHRWVKPNGHDTGIKVFNCTARTKVPLIVKNKNLVTWYTCGPTVYDSSHIGHASCFVKLDIIQRLLRHYFNLNVVTVMNITDIDDKIIARANTAKVPPKELAKKFEAEFWKDLDALDVRRPDCVLRVTENMDVIKNFIRELIDKGKAYKAGDNSVYFDVGAYDNYAKLQNIGEDAPEPSKFKKSKMDFALWKAAKPGEISWVSEWGKGRPGWHIECSALAGHVLGPEIDIHAGGIDLRFPHHENEEAQSCARYCRPQWVNYWLHTGHLHLKDSQKMSKSLHNTISISSMLEDTTAPAFRMACLMSHYRSRMEYSNEFVITASKVLQNYINFVDNCQNYLNGYLKADVDNDTVSKLVVESANKIHSALIDDFNTSEVISTINELISAVNSILHSSRTDLCDTKSVAVIAASNLVSSTLNMFGINVNKKQSSVCDNYVEVMNILNDFRQSIRQLGISNKDKNVLELCDKVRDNLKSIGITIKDHGKMSSWS
ncbi:probable cysteine--tRNA ligase, mitochondrial [Tribolium castaneum]|uniref:Cysteine--tRNA ligase n=1 Tax=Tribolium castaneum TaxID=7070 RepID=D6W8J3_TRICA|nr:PREDICTED: probable cysteine--tRNA ligase, mitochondrial [Tribolium castaneum]EEZ98366.2 putative cysteine--tRNA ligase, mitochondrial-like Protein [Tribolium castaneum]|eukprot:XP_973716.2 PREDICTED: probable cysteine--tRNA ligase, mitochondrial [Tribolium castaneum]